MDSGSVSDADAVFGAVAVGISGGAAGLLLTDAGVVHSPVSRATLVVTHFVGLIALSQATNDDRLTLWAYVAIVVSAVAVVLEVTDTVAIATLGGALVLFLLTIALFDIAARFGAPGRFVSGPRVKQLFVAVVVLAAVVVTVDVVSGGLAYELRTGEEAHVAAGSDAAPVAFLGEIAVTNSGPFPQRVSIPEYDVCPAGNWSAYRPKTGDGETLPVTAHLEADGYYGEYVSGFEQQRYAAILLLGAENVDGKSFPIERTDRCPDEDDAEPYLAVFRGEETQP
jgi:hypothetical protein